MSAAAAHVVESTGAPFYNFDVGSVKLLVSITKQNDWEIISSMSDRAASAVPLVSGWEHGSKWTRPASVIRLFEGPRKPHNKHSAHCVVTSGREIICDTNGTVEDCQLPGCSPPCPASCGDGGSGAQAGRL